MSGYSKFFEEDGTISSDLDVRFASGERNKPLLVFVHGMGMNANMWADPAKARIMGGKYPLRSLLSSSDTPIESSYQDMTKRGFPVLSWSQSRPVGPIQVAVDELDALIKSFRQNADAGIVFICHSRGGLIARKYLETENSPVRGIITIATPHAGTSMAKWAIFLSPVTFPLYRLLKNARKKEVDSALRRILGFLCSRGLYELLPDSRFFAELSDKRKSHMKYISVGGTNPDLLKAVPVSLPEVLSKALPGWVLPDEMREGYGDGLVTASSARSPFADEHINVHLNHASILFDKTVREYVGRQIESLP